MNMATFQKAERKQAWLKLAFTGPSGSGKTFSALLLSAGIGKRIAVIDTENRSASLYAGMKEGPLAGIEFDVLEIEAPYTIDKYTDAIELAERLKYDVLIIDSISHAWAGEGGLLDKKSALDNRPGANTYTSWGRITPEHEKFKARLLGSNIHLVCTMRSKQDYVLEINEKGKQEPRKVGLAPIQRDGMEYEFTTVFDLAMDHNAAISKDRTGLFDGKLFKITRKTGPALMAWLKEGKPMPAPEAKAEPAKDAPPAAESEAKAKQTADPVPSQPAAFKALMDELRGLGHVFGETQKEYINSLRTDRDFEIAFDFFGKKRDAYLAAKGNGRGKQA